MLFILSFIFGASVGSFVQVVAGRLHVAPILKGRSKCLSCGEALRPSDLVPVFSYLFLKGRCRYCGARYGSEALIVEVIFGLTFLFLYQLILRGQPTLLESFLWLVYYTLLFGTLGVMALYDRTHSYVPTPFLGSFLILSFAMYGIRLYGGYDTLSLLAPVFVALPFFVVWLLTRGKGLGFGDILIYIGVGAFFGSLQGFAVFVISVWLGALSGIYIKYRAHDGAKHVAIPFVPYIALAFVFVLFTGIDILSITSIFS